MARHSTLGALVASLLVAGCAVRDQGLAQAGGGGGGGNSTTTPQASEGPRPAAPDGGAGAPGGERDGSRPVSMMMTAPDAPAAGQPDGEAPSHDAAMGKSDAALAPTDAQPADRALAASDAPPSPPSAMVAYWKFDEASGAVTAADSSGNGNDGMLTILDPTKAWEPGHLGNAIHISEAGHVVLVKPSPSIDAVTTSFTIAAWVKKAMARAGYASIISRQLGGNGNDAFNLGFIEGRLRFNGDRLAEVIAPDAAPAVGTWAHVAVTYDGQRVRLWINATEVAATMRMGNIGPVNRPVVIGGNQNGTGITEPTEALIDELRIYGRALAPSEIAALAQ